MVGSEASYECCAGEMESWVAIVSVIDVDKVAVIVLEDGKVLCAKEGVMKTYVCHRWNWGGVRQAVRYSIVVMCDK